MPSWEMSKFKRTVLYTNFHNDLSKGYIVEIEMSTCFKTEQTLEWYLLHHHPHKPDKVRRVLNGAAKFHGHSLNNTLLTGPDLLQNLMLSPLFFGKHPYAVSADIEGMFLQVEVISKDPLSLHFCRGRNPQSRFQCLSTLASTVATLLLDPPKSGRCPET